MWAQCLKITQNVAFFNFVKIDHFFNELFCPLKNVNVARFARNVECDFYYDFQTPCVGMAFGYQLWMMVQSSLPISFVVCLK